MRLFRTSLACGSWALWLIKIRDLGTERLGMAKVSLEDYPVAIFSVRRKISARNVLSVAANNKLADDFLPIVLLRNTVDPEES